MVAQRLWILNHYATGPGATTGTRHYDLGRELVRLGWEVTIFAASPHHGACWGYGAPYSGSATHETHDGVHFVWLRVVRHNRNDWKRVLSMLIYVPAAILAGWSGPRPHVVIGSSVHPFAAWAAYILARHHRAPFFFEVRDLWPQTLIDLSGISPRHPAIRALAWLERLLCREAERIIVLLPNAHEYIEALGVPRTKVTHVPNGVDLSRYERPLPALPVEIKEVLDRLGGRFIAVYLGAHGLANHLDTLLDAAKRLRQSGEEGVHILLVGDGPDRPRLVRRAVQEGLGNVTFLAPVDKRYVPPLLDRCSAGVVCLAPSRLYRYGVSLNKVFDYMAARLPVVMTGVAAGNPVIDSGGGVVLGGDDAAGLAGTLCAWNANPERVRELGSLGRAFVEARHSSKTLAALLDRELRSHMPCVNSTSRRDHACV